MSTLGESRIRNAELYAEVYELRAANAELLAALKEAVDDAEDYAAYAGAYLAEKWGTADDIARYRAVIHSHEGGDRRREAPLPDDN